MGLRQRNRHAASCAPDLPVQSLPRGNPLRPRPTPGSGRAGSCPSHDGQLLTASQADDHIAEAFMLWRHRPDSPGNSTFPSLTRQASNFCIRRRRSITNRGRRSANSPMIRSGQVRQASGDERLFRRRLRAQDLRTGAVQKATTVAASAAFRWRHRCAATAPKDAPWPAATAPTPHVGCATTTGRRPASRPDGGNEPRRGSGPCGNCTPRGSVSRSQPAGSGCAASTAARICKGWSFSDSP